MVALGYAIRKRIALTKWYLALSDQAQRGLSTEVTQNSAYLKELCCDILSVISAQQGIAGPPEQAALTLHYMGKLADQIHPDAPEARHQIVRLIEQIHPHRSKQICWKHLALSATLIQEGQALQQKFPHDDYGLYMSYFIAIHPSKGWVWDEIPPQNKEALFTVLDPIRYPIGRPANRLSTSHVLVKRRLIEYLNRHHKTGTPAELFNQVHLIMTILHMFHLGARCDQFTTSASGETFREMSECLLLFVNFLTWEILS